MELRARRCLRDFVKNAEAVRVRRQQFVTGVCVGRDVLPLSTTTGCQQRQSDGEKYQYFSIQVCLSILRQRKNDDRRRAGRNRPETGRAARCDGHVLFAIDRVGHDATVHRAASVESVQHFAGLGIQRQKIAGQLAGKNQIRGRGCHRSQHRFC